MSMYALQVMTGMEAEITQKLRGKGVDARDYYQRFYRVAWTPDARRSGG